MINTITGIVTTAHDQSITLQVGPVSLSFMVPDAAQFQVQQSQLIHIYMHWNSEQGPSLYGFSSELDKSIFLVIISCSGIGPKIGLAVLGSIGAQSFLEAVHTGNDRALSKVSGIGAKKAEQMIVQLKHKVAQLLSSGMVMDASKALTNWHTLSQALEALSYSRHEISQAIQFLREQNRPDQTFDQLLRQALSFLAKKQ